MAQLVASMSGVVLGGVVEVVGSNLSAQLIHYIPLYAQILSLVCYFLVCMQQGQVSS